MTLLEQLFPGLRTSAYLITSPRDRQYNCIAWAAGDCANWWWPTAGAADVPRFWPAGVPREETLAAFIMAFATLDFAPADNETLESGVEKVALFVDANGIPTHAARQLGTGRWTSKLGFSEDIEHELHALEGDVYGAIAIVLRRLRRA